GMVCVVGRMRDLILQLSKSSIYSTKPEGQCTVAAFLPIVVIGFIERCTNINAKKCTRFIYL
ncbi:hypothetical protein NF328_07500, partial [Enterobacter hormaechei]|nr:hypothetical protein [Enterobacter hormaechei]